MDIIKKLSRLLIIVFVITSCQNKGKKNQEGKTNGLFPPELVAFEPYGNNPVFSGTGSDTWDKMIRERGFILYDEGIYKMWYTGYNPEKSRLKFLGYATSTDGIKWERYSDQPIFSGKWVEDMIVVKDQGVYYMFAEGDKDVAHLLTAANGINWEEQGDLTMLTTKGDTIPGPYGTPTVWIENGKWFLFYERNDLGIWLAETDDKLIWQNVQDEPVLKLGPVNYDLAAVAANQVIKYNNRYYIYYHATDRTDWQSPSSPVIWTSNVATSEDLIHWDKYPENPFVKGDYSSPILVFADGKPILYTMHPQVNRYLPEQ